MHRLILAYVPGDEAAAHDLSAALAAHQPLAMPARGALQLGAGAVLGVIWSARAAANAGDLLRWAQQAAGAVLLRADATPLSPALSALRMVEIDPQQGEAKCAAALRFAQRLRSAQPMSPRAVAAVPAARGVEAAAPAQEPPRYRRMFVSGMGRGFASSIAVLSLGAGAAAGVQQQAGVFNLSLDFSHGGGASVHEASLRPGDPMRGLVSEQELSRQATSLRQTAAAERQAIFAKLDVAAAQLAEARSRTDARIARLAALSANQMSLLDAAAKPEAPARMAGSARETQTVRRETPLGSAHVQSVALAAPARHIADLRVPMAGRDLTAYAEHLDSTVEYQIEADKLELWTPT